MNGVTFNTGVIAGGINQPLLDHVDRQPAPNHGGGLGASIRSALETLGQRFTDSIQQITRTGAHSPEAVFARANPYTTALAEAPSIGENGFTDTGILSRHGDQMLEKLDTYRQAVGSSLSDQEMRALINTGEHLVNAISRGDVEGGRITLTVNGNTFNVDSSTHTTRAIGWYLTAKTAEVEITQGGDHMVTKGSLVMKDPGNKLFDFLNAAPTSYSRISSHFNERAMPDAPLDRLTGRPLQRGIEDFSNKLPGGKGAMLFDKLQNEELFMKFEHVGMPTVFRMSGHGESHNTIGEKIGNVFNSIKRCLLHSVSFITSRFDTNAAGFGVHREHAHKDATRGAVLEPFMQVMDHMEGTEPGQEGMPEEMVALGKKYGTEFMDDFLAGLPSNLLRVKEGHQDQFAADLAAAKDSIAAFRAEQGPDFGAIRKGMESHVSLQTYPTELLPANEAELETVALD